jgi:hypothetical protein
MYHMVDIERPMGLSKAYRGEGGVMCMEGIDWESDCNVKVEVEGDRAVERTLLPGGQLPSIYVRGCLHRRQCIETPLAAQMVVDKLEQ